MALGGKVVNLVGLDLLDDPDHVRRVGKVAIMKKKACAGGVRVDVKMVDAACVEERRTTLDAVDLVALPEQELGQVGAASKCRRRFGAG
jgi:hypothetical protein